MKSFINQSVILLYDKYTQVVLNSIFKTIFCDYKVLSIFLNPLDWVIATIINNKDT